MRHILPSFVVGRDVLPASPNVVGTLYRIVKIHSTRALHTIFFVQPHFRGHPRILESIGATVAVDK